MAEEAPQVEQRVEQVDQAEAVLIITDQGVPVLQDRAMLEAQVRQVVDILEAVEAEPVLRALMEQAGLTEVMDYNTQLLEPLHTMLEAGEAVVVTAQVMVDKAEAVMVVVEMALLIPAVVEAAPQMKILPWVQEVLES